MLHAHPAAQQSLFDHITKSVPGTLGTQLHSSIKTAITARTGVGIIGLVGVLITGLGWIGNLRTAIDGVWGHKPAKRNFVKAKLQNLGILVGLGLGIIVSLGLTVLGTALTDKILSALDLDHVTGAGTMVRILGLLLAVLGDVIIFWWLLVRLPAGRCAACGRDPRRRSSLPSAWRCSRSSAPTRSRPRPTARRPARSPVCSRC